MRLLINCPARFEGVRVTGVGEYAWCHAPYGDTCVTVILDVTLIRYCSDPSRCVDIVPDHSKEIFETWLDSRSHLARAGHGSRTHGPQDV